MSGLPQGWAEVPFGELNGFRARSIDPANFPDEEFELYSVPVFPTGKPEIARGKDIGSTKQLVSPGDVLVCKINPRINRVWMVSQPSKLRQIASSEWIVIRADGIYACYLRAFFSSPEFREELCTDLTGVGGSLTRAQPKRVATYAVPLAPLPEQTRIADKLDALLARVDAARERLNRVPALLKRFRQSVLAAATSGELTEDWRGGEAVEWPKTKLGTIVDCQSGVGFPPALQGQDAGDYPFAKVSDISKAVLEAGGMVSTANNWIGAEDAKALRAKIIPAGATIFAKIGEGLKLNRRAIVQVPLLIDNNCMALLPREGCVDPKYLYLFMRTVDLGEFAIATAVPSIRRSDIESIELALPPMDEQREIIRRVEALFALADKVQAQYDTARARVDKLTPALLAKAFRGELVPQDPNDEPASVLLERLRTSKASEATPAKRGRKPSTDAAKTRTAR